jgi:glycosyltransferase involved in cell wall biosynthesis
MTSIFKLPSWLHTHFYTGKKFSDLTPNEIEDLKNRLSKFRDENPEVSVVIPAWNEEDNIHHTLSSLASNTTKLRTEIIVINNNSTDGTQKVLDTLGVRSFFEQNQGIAFARQRGLEVAKGKYHLCADSDTFYPPLWIELMTKPMIRDKTIVGVYGRYSFIPPKGDKRFFLWIYEKVTGLLVHIRKRKREYINVLGFTMGFVTDIGRSTGGFRVHNARKFNNIKDSDDFVDESEDGTMAINLKTKGRLKLVTDADAFVYTSSRRLLAEGGIKKAFFNRIRLHKERMVEYVTGK